MHRSSTQKPTTVHNIVHTYRHIFISEKKYIAILISKTKKEPKGNQSVSDVSQAYIARPLLMILVLTLAILQCVDRRKSKLSIRIIKFYDDLITSEDLSAVTILNQHFLLTRVSFATTIVSRK